jgi:hypothetical protein
MYFIQHREQTHTHQPSQRHHARSLDRATRTRVSSIAKMNRIAAALLLCALLAAQVPAATSSGHMPPRPQKRCPKRCPKRSASACRGRLRATGPSTWATCWAGAPPPLSPPPPTRRGSATRWTAPPSRCSSRWTTWSSGATARVRRPGPGAAQAGLRSTGPPAGAIAAPPPEPSPAAATPPTGLWATTTVEDAKYEPAVYKAFMVGGPAPAPAPGPGPGPGSGEQPRRTCSPLPGCSACRARRGGGVGAAVCAPRPGRPLLRRRRRAHAFAPPPHPHPASLPPQRLFKYISGENEAGVKVAMTAPVRTKVYPSQGPFCASNFTVAFFVPDEYQVGGGRSAQALPPAGRCLAPPRRRGARCRRVWRKQAGQAGSFGGQCQLLPCARRSLIVGG